MSDDELIVRLGIQARQAEKRLVSAQLKAQQVAGALRMISGVLDSAYIASLPDLEKDLAILPTRDEVLRMVSEIQDARQAKSKADADLRKAESL